MSSEPEMVISMRTFVDEETDLFGVELYVSGIKDQQQADAAVAFLRKTLCGEQVTTQ